MPPAPNVNRGPELYWRCMRVMQREMGYFSSRAIVDIAGGIHRKTVENYLRYLLDEQVIAIQTSTRNGAVETRRYTILRDSEAPPPRRTGDHTFGLRQQALWTTMRQLRRWSPSELAGSASTDILAIANETAVGYARDLLRAGYLAEANEGNRTFYRLLPHRNTGPRAPIVLRKQRACFDLNLMQVLVASNRRAA